MDNVSPQGFQQGNFRPSESLATAPPPPSEVKIRTMRTDLESMAKSGGGLPRFQNIKVGGSAADRVVAPVFVAPPAIAAPASAPVVETAAPAPASAPASQPSQLQSKPQVQPQMGGKSKTNVFGIVATIIILAALAFGGWFAYTKFFANQAAAPISPTAPATQTQTNSPAAQSPTAPAPAPSNSASVPVLVLPSPASSTASTTP